MFAKQAIIYTHSYTRASRYIYHRLQSGNQIKITSSSNEHIFNRLDIVLVAVVFTLHILSS